MHLGRGENSFIEITPRKKIESMEQLMYLPYLEDLRFCQRKFVAELIMGRKLCPLPKKGQVLTSGKEKRKVITL
jgi:hypothetical protein